MSFLAGGEKGYKRRDLGIWDRFLLPPSGSSEQGGIYLVFALLQQETLEKKKKKVSSDTLLNFLPASTPPSNVS